MTRLLSVATMGLAIGVVLLHTILFGLSCLKERQPGLLGALVLCAANAAAFAYLLFSR
ncbi:hypothetical protein [Paenibacillus antri]|uniref:hypothetical protein n=1 Tax=Paenibacillus antri TaxID=2582848 RepID=UPI0013050A83|nr:hypothetical protein [Paenibacillus antri]